MSVLFPKLNKPREWDYRPIYYDEEKEARKEKLARLQAERRKREQQEASVNQTDGVENAAQSTEDYVPTLHRGSFREARDAAANGHRSSALHTSRLSFWIVLLLGVLFILWVLS